MDMKRKWKKQDGAVSEVIGAIMMVGIGVALFSVLYFIVMSYPFTPPVPSVDIVGSIQGNSIVLEHRGGDSLDQNATVSFIVGGARTSDTVGFFLNDTNGNHRWDIGEQLVYHYNLSGNMTGLQVEATVVDRDSNSIMMMGVLQEGETTVIPPLIPSLNTSVNPISPYNQTSSPLAVSATGDSGLNNVTLYYRWSDDNTSWDGGYSIVDDAVDSNLCNVDGSSDIGTETNFVNAQEISPDTDVMTVQEVDVRGQNYNDAIDSNTCDVDGSPDKGTETNFVNAKGINPDTNVMTIQEANQGWSAGNENKVVDSWSSTYTSWTETGITPYLDADDYNTNYITTATRNINEGWFTFADTTAPAGATVTCTIYVNGWRSNTNGADDYADIYVDYTGGSGSDTGDACTTIDSNGVQTINIGGLTVAQANALRVYFRSIRVGGQMGTLYVDYAYVNFQWSANLDYEADFEYQFTGANFTQDTKQVCIYVASHTGSETLNVNYRNGGSWTNLGSITNTGWTNLTATGLTSATYTIQLIGNTEAGDSFQDSWNIDLIKLHCWNNSNYQIDFEYNWTGANFISSMENLCMYVISHTGSENLNVYYWTGSAWLSLDTITVTGWSNFTANGLNSSNYTIQLKGATESGDLVQDSWNIDVIMLHIWNTTGGGTSGNWYDANWIYRKKINITGQAGAGPNYQVLLNIGETSGVSGANFNLGGHSSNFPSGKNIGGDLRFINKSGTTSLDFWVEDVSGTTPNRLAKVWVEVKDSLNSSTSIYCYYGNPSASNASNGTNTFNFFDNFDDNSIDASKWTTYQGTWSETGGILRQTSTGSVDPKKCIATSAPQSNYYAIRAKVRPDAGTDADGRAGLSIKTSAANGESYNYVFHNFVTKTTEQFLDDHVAWGTSYTRTAWSFGTWYWFEIYHDGTNVRGRVWNVGGTLGAFNSWTTSGRSGYLALNGGSMGETASFDDVFVRKCIATEPSYSSAGTEETYIGGGGGHNWIIYTGYTNPDLNSPWSWSINFPEGVGYYEFYSIGRYAGAVEGAPVSADARCRKT